MSHPSQQTLDILGALVGFDTVSHRSNLDLITYAADLLTGLGIPVRVLEDVSGAKANLFATIGKADADTGGLMLAGHTDVVPVDGQDWTTDPFTATVRDGKLFARGACDMKGFLATALMLADEFSHEENPPPVHLAFTFDEETGCFGGRQLAGWLEALPVRPAYCVVGEPTGMHVVDGHKGKLSIDCQVHGREGHSAHNDQAVNAVEIAAELIARLRAMQRKLATDGEPDNRFDPSHTTIHTGLIQGGIARNIVPRDCAFEFEIRNLPQDDPAVMLEEIESFAERELLPGMHAISAETGLRFDIQSDIPALRPDPESVFVRRALGLTGANAPRQIAFTTEAGLYQDAGIPTIVCGPGHIAQAHRPDEYVALDQIAACETFIRGLVASLPQRPA